MLPLPVILPQKSGAWKLYALCTAILSHFTDFCYLKSGIHYTAYRIHTAPLSNFWMSVSFNAVTSWLIYFNPENIISFYNIFLTIHRNCKSWSKTIPALLCIYSVLCFQILLPAPVPRYIVLNTVQLLPTQYSDVREILYFSLTSHTPHRIPARTTHYCNFRPALPQRYVKTSYPSSHRASALLPQEL